MSLYSRYIFAPLMDWSLSRPEIDELRHLVVGGATSNVLEIGYGTGLNLPHYWPDVSLTLLDSECLMPKRVKQRIAACPAKSVRQVVGTAEKLPFEDASFGAVVSTFTLCSIRDVSAALAEIRRVLIPKGGLLFLEHGRADNPAVARWQDRLNPLQQWIACGCNLNRPIDQFLRQSGYELPMLNRCELPRAPRIMGSLYHGIAVPKHA